MTSRAPLCKWSRSTLPLRQSNDFRSVSRSSYRQFSQLNTHVSDPKAPVLHVDSIPAPHTGRIKLLSINRPDARNALSRALVGSLNEAITDIQAEPQNGPTRAVIIASQVDKVFCAGADLKERAKFTPEETTQFLRSLRETFSKIAALPIPTIAAINGFALGGGLELGLACDFRIVSSHATLGLPETRLGIIPGAGGTYRLAKLIGAVRARDLIFTGRMVQGREARQLGIADRVVDVDVNERGKEGGLVLQEAQSLAAEISKGAPLAIRAAVKALKQEPFGGPELEKEAYDMVVRTRDRDEALLAFAQKRDPVFKGH